MTSMDNYDMEHYETLAKCILALNGYDKLNRPQIVIHASKLPDPKTVNYTMLLSHLLSIADSIISDTESYTLIVFCKSTKYRPKWTWLIQAYKNMQRKYKKNLKAIYFVQTTWWYRLMLELMSNFFSPRFARKIKHINSIHELESLVNMPDSAEYSDYRPQSSLRKASPINSDQKFFDFLGTYPNGEMQHFPECLEKLFDHIRTNALDVNGIFSETLSANTIENIRPLLNQYPNVNYKAYDPRDVASLIKFIYSSLPEPLLLINDAMKSLTVGFYHCPPSFPVSDKTKAALENTLNFLTQPQVVLLYELAMLLNYVAQHSACNRMTEADLSLATSICLIGNQLQDLKADPDACIYIEGLANFWELCIKKPDTLFLGFDLWNHDCATLSSNTTQTENIEDYFNTRTPEDLKPNKHVDSRGMVAKPSQIKLVQTKQPLPIYEGGKLKLRKSMPNIKQKHKHSHESVKFTRNPKVGIVKDLKLYFEEQTNTTTLRNE